MIIQLKPGNIFLECVLFKGLRPKTFEENQLKYVVQQNMLLRVLELGYDNEFQTQIFSLIVTKICEEPRVCFRVQHEVGCISLPEANCMKTVFTSRKPDTVMGVGGDRETTGNPDTLCG